QLIQHADAIRELRGVELLIAAEGEALQAARSIVEYRVHDHPPARQIEVRPTVAVRAAHAHRRLLEDSEAEVAVVPRLDPGIPTSAFAAGRGKRGRATANRCLPIPSAVEGEVECLPGRRRRRREIDAAEDRSLVARAIARHPANRGWHLLLAKDPEETKDRIRRHPRRLQAKR